jgi:hypothetical protein
MRTPPIRPCIPDASITFDAARHGVPPLASMLCLLSGSSATVNVMGTDVDCGEKFPRFVTLPNKQYSVLPSYPDAVGIVKARKFLEI